MNGSTGSNHNGGGAGGAEISPAAFVLPAGEATNWGLPVNDNRLPRKLLLKRIAIWAMLLAAAASLAFI